MMDGRRMTDYAGLQKYHELSKLKENEGIEQEKKDWTRTSPADLYYMRDKNHPKLMRATSRLVSLCKKFNVKLLERAEKARATYKPQPHRPTRCKSEKRSQSSSVEENLKRKKHHPQSLHPEIWFNDSGEMNNGQLLCQCSARARGIGIHHGIYVGETHLAKCDSDTNNADKLFHYRITISPSTNFLAKIPTIIKHDDHEFIFDGFSMFSHYSLDKFPTCRVIRFDIEYTIHYIKENIPENFAVIELDLFYEYLFHELLELVDLDFKAQGDSSRCPQFHFMPRFVRNLEENGKEILSMNEVLKYLICNSKPLIKEESLKEVLEMPQTKWKNFADEVKGMIVTYPGKKPSSVRVDKLDHNQQEGEFPEIVHFGKRPPHTSYMGNPKYQKLWEESSKLRHLLANKRKPSFEDKKNLELKESLLLEMRSQMNTDVAVTMSAKDFYRTGLMSDIVQHAMLIPVLVSHLRFHRSCNFLEKVMSYKFKNRYLLQLALTHPSHREGFGTNPDHVRNSLVNCGIRQPEYGSGEIHSMHKWRHGINTLTNVMSRFGKKEATESKLRHNERLEFLGDAVVGFLTALSLFHMFPDMGEGGMTSYKVAIVQNENLAELAGKLGLEHYLLYAHGSDLCRAHQFRHVMANCFEALMGALFLDGGIEVAGTVFAEMLFRGEDNLMNFWVNYPQHPLQEQEPMGDRKWIPLFEILQNLTRFEDSIGVKFKHIRLLAKAFTMKSVGYNYLTEGSNQRLEFLGDSVLQLISSEYLYKYFPKHHEGHLSLLRSSLVNNNTLAVICNDFGMADYAICSHPKTELKSKDRADLVEAFLGAFFIDKGLDFCQRFCDVCLFPRLQDFIKNQNWNSPKCKLQQCYLTLRDMKASPPDVPEYKVIETKGPSNCRTFIVAVYFQGKRLAAASGHSIQQAEMNAATEALKLSQDIFPQLKHQKRVFAKCMQDDDNQ
ncbi:Ribonuclease 3 [Blattella germanica]|nr:Ribonuclease 3 [Blattella germanica]